MLEQPVEIETPDGIADGLILRPSSGASGPGVVHLTDIRGIRESQRAVVRPIVEQRFVVLMPNVFYRTGRPPVFDPSIGSADERMKRFQALTRPLTSDAMERDMAAYIDFLVAQPFVHKGRIGLVGYCFSGKLALHGAAVRPRTIGAAASFHGGGLVMDAPASPHHLLPRIQAALYFGHASDDASMPDTAIATLNGALAAWGGEYESEVYAGARHGWTMPDHEAYNAPQADRAREKLSALLNRTLRK